MIKNFLCRSTFWTRHKSFNHFLLNRISIVVFDIEQLMHRGRSTIRLAYCLLLLKYCINMLRLIIRILDKCRVPFVQVHLHTCLQQPEISRRNFKFSTVDCDLCRKQSHRNKPYINSLETKINLEY